MRAKTPTTLLSPEAFLKFRICPKTNTSSCTPQSSKSRYVDSLEPLVCLRRWPAHRRNEESMFDDFLRRYRLHKIPIDPFSTQSHGSFTAKYIEPTIQLINNEFLVDESPTLRCEVDAGHPEYWMARIVTDECPSGANDDIYSSSDLVTLCHHLVIVIDPAMAIDWTTLDPKVKRISLAPDNIARPFFDVLVAECRRLGCPHGMLTDEHHTATLFFPPLGYIDKMPPNPNSNFFILQSSVIDIPIRWTLASSVCFAIGQYIKPSRLDELCLGALGNPGHLECGFSTELEAIQSRRSFRDFDLYTLQRCPGAWDQFMRWRVWAAQQALDPQTRVEPGSVLSVDCDGFRRKHCLWRCPFPNPRPPQETIDIVTRSPRPRDSTIDRAIAEASSSGNRLSFEITDVKREGLEYFSQVYVGRLQGVAQAVCLKLFDERLFPFTHEPQYGNHVRPETQLLNLNFADDMMRREEAVYCDRLQYLQGSLIPHCYGFHIFTLPDGWEVLGFFMELIDGPSLWEVGQRIKSPALQACIVTHVRHVVRALGFAGVEQGDWHLDQILCPPQSSLNMSVDGVDDRQRDNGHPAFHSMVLIDFAFAPQRLGEDCSRPGHPVLNPSILMHIIQAEIGISWDVLKDHWTPMMEEEY
ncbi:hypothetical protein HETIRDRAFT_174152 [Heterobasidion irregulare TC 32-1]|uniref:Protein kinase domain-containing protein n=1 Tax=Heterobasidion irregulare (strain TC 32-1) TaxID=747525 RepID=W4JUH7_HETIT|nr:uncharacterized protein HETIRDRAFT_174152 [Heterobasidion irregulare TC 32-1]ETW77208.1 hypothetical protein HETIRDRAFT_174152 [Heterobasidion irregulare TC 32-1]